MSFIRTIPVAEATGELQAVYKQYQETSGHVPNYVTAFSLRPDVWKALRLLIDAIKGTMDLRRYELVTVAAATAMECSYCTIVHGKVLSDKFLGPEQTAIIARDFRRSELSAADKAIVVFVQKMTLRARDVTQQDVDELRGHGLTDAEIFDVASATSVRCFMSKFLDGVGAEPDHFYADMEPALRQALTVGREIEQPPAR